LARDSQLKVLLIELNLRTPSLHEVFKIDPIPGLSDFVGRDGRVTSIAGCENPIKVQSGGPYVIPCGRNHSEPAVLLQSSAFNLFLKKMRDSYDFVILDAPPVHRFPESQLLCAMVDGVVLVIKAGTTRRQVALSAKKQLEQAGASLLGVVLNKRRHYIPDFIYRKL
jgi:capsular exopolysaccharide synthesis family protein